jgi:glycosyltransferase involved in cell wall biosynthesis
VTGGRRPLRVLVLPSWYPHRGAPVQGVFTLEQVLATGDLRPEWALGLGLWGQGEYDFALRRPGEWPRRLAAYLHAGPRRRELRANVVEHRYPAATWARQLLGGNLRGIVHASRRAFEAAAAELGGIDLIHAHVGFPAGLAAMRLREQLGVPYVVTEHWHYPPKGFVRRDGSLDKPLHTALAGADALIAVSRAQAADIAACGLPTPEVVPAAVNEREFAPGPQRASERIVLCSICNVAEGKGIDDLLTAVSRLLPSLDPSVRGRVELRVGGDGPALNRYRRLADELGIAASTRWLGWLSREQVRRELQACRCFVLASPRESFGVVYAEAIACGKPVIAARAGGPEEIVSDATGILVDPRDVGQLTEALQTMIESPNLPDPQTIREEFLRRFSRPVSVARLEDVYRGVTGT